MHIINPKAATEKENRDFPGGPGLRIPGFHRHGPGSLPSWGAETHKPCSITKKRKRKNENKMDYRRYIIQRNQARGRKLRDKKEMGRIEST